MAVEPRRDNAAIAEQYPATFHRLQRMFRARGIPREEAADLAQETATRLLIHFDRHGQIDGRDDPTPLINRIATNLMIDRARSHARRVVSLDALEEEHSTGESLEDVVSRRQHRFMVRRAMRELNDRQRLAIALSLDGLSPAEIAETLGLERNAADALLHRARRRLGERLRAMPGELHGLSVVALLRLRALGKRSAEAAERVAAAVPAAVPALSAAFVLAFAGSTSAGAIAPATAAVATRAPATVPSSLTAIVAPSRAAVAQRRTVEVDARAQRVALQTQVHDPVSGEDGPAGVQVWRDVDRPGLPGPGITGPALDTATGSACSASPSACDTGE